MFRKCCCHHAPAIIILDVILILIIIGEFLLVFQNKIIEIVQENDQEDFAHSGSSNEPPLYNTTNVESTISFNIWQVSANSIFVIPANTILIAAGLRMLFCQFHIEIMKLLMLLILLTLFVTSVIGMILIL